MIPEIRLPSDDELFAACSAKYAIAAATYIDNWPDEWRALSMGTTLVKLPADAIAEMFEAHDGRQEFPVLSVLAAEIDAAMNWDAQFIRLNTRSPKDFEPRPITCAGRQAIHWLIGSMRTIEDLSMLNLAKKPAFIALRKQVYIRKSSELRCFVKGGSLIAICQYFYDRPQRTWQSEAKRHEAWGAIEAFWRSAVHPPSPIQDYVFDVALQGAGQPLMIEVNPYGLSDPCAAKTYENIERGGFFYVAAPEAAT